jgi:oxygen-independent coproporphyrinogen-3 oxidase
MYEFAIDQLAEQGWEHYEVSNFALPGYRCRHNEAYWLGQPWWAFGPGAARFLRDPTQGWIRSVNHRSTTTYIRKIQSGQSPTSEFDILTREDYVRERLVFGLRRLEGVNLRELDPYNHYGPVESLFEPFLTEFIDAGWLERDHDQIRLTRPGLFVSDSLWPDLLTPFLNEQDAS